MSAINNHSGPADVQQLKRVEELLTLTSRTFALAIPLLAPSRRTEVGVAYLLFRVADSIEDAPGKSLEVKLRMLQSLTCLISRSKNAFPSDQGMDTDAVLSQLRTFRWSGTTHSEQSSVNRLFEFVPELLSLLEAQQVDAADIIRRSLIETIGGMSRFLSEGADSQNDIEIRDLEQLRLYCYYVAGIVGEMLSDLFVRQHPAAAAVHGQLRLLGKAFGECLQLTNILKDAGGDAAERRVFIPPGTARSDVFDLAFKAADDGHRYLDLLRQNAFPEDVISFCTLPLLLAEETLHRVHRDGPGSRLQRGEVMQILNQVIPSN